MQLKALGFVGRAIAPPGGPVLALTPDAGGADSAPDASSIDWDMLDPVSPVAGGEHYEPRTPRGRRGGRRGNVQNPYIEALYPEGSGGDDEDQDETTATVAALLAPKPVPQPEPGDPHARAGVVAAATASVASPTYFRKI